MASSDQTQTEGGLFRADQLLVMQKLARSRTQAQRWIEHGCVKYFHQQHWQVVKKPGLKLPLETQFEISPEAEDRFVSRGGLKLFGAFQRLDSSPNDETWLDIGQSTGGFTDCLLQMGAAKVVGIDVGKNQLVDALKTHPNVSFFEGINARALPSTAELGESDLFDGICIDVSFISQTLVVDGLKAVLKPGGKVLALVKPQFELQPDQIGKGGIVKNEALYAEVEQKIRLAYQESGFDVLDFFPSSIKGGDGNREFFIFAECN